VANIKRIYFSAFPKDESEIVSKLAIELLSDNSTPQTISLNAEVNESAVGHIAFSPVVMDNNENCQAYILAPLAVQASWQKRRIGSTLIKYGMRKLSDIGVSIIFVYGDPKYYGRFGFNADTAHKFTAPYNLQYPFAWLAIALNEWAIVNTPATITCVDPLCDPKLW
jgi:putative acetyltransferase